MHERGILDGAFDSDRHSVMDVATFYMRLLRVRRENRLKISDGLRRLVEWVRLHMLKWIAGAVEAYVLGVYSEDNPLTHLAPPALMHKFGSKRKYTVVSGEAAWDVMAKARENALIWSRPSGSRMTRRLWVVVTLAVRRGCKKET